jgi:hypothetical protein
MRMTLNTLLLLSLTAVANAKDHTPLASLVSKIESNGNPQAIGDFGLARGEYQFHKEAWLQASKERRKAGKKVYPYAYAHDPLVSQQYAVDYLGWIEKALKGKMGRSPLNWEIYAAYARGVESFASLGFSFDKLPKHTQATVSRVAQTFNETIK